MNTGSILMGRASLGSWAAYGLGTENQNLPAFVVLPDPGGWPKGGAPAWGNGYLPAAYHGTLLRGGSSRQAFASCSFTAATPTVGTAIPTWKAITRNCARKAIGPWPDC